MRIHEDVWLKLAREKAGEMAREASVQRGLRGEPVGLRRRAAHALLALAGWLSPESYPALPRQQHKPCA